MGFENWKNRVREGDEKDARKAALWAAERDKRKARGMEEKLSLRTEAEAKRQIIQIGKQTREEIRVCELTIKRYKDQIERLERARRTINEQRKEAGKGLSDTKEVTGDMQELEKGGFRSSLKKAGKLSERYGSIDKKLEKIDVGYEAEIVQLKTKLSEQEELSKQKTQSLRDKTGQYEQFLKENREKRERTEEERVAEEENRKKEGWQKFRMEHGEDYSRGNAPEQVVSAAGREGDERAVQRENKEGEEGMERIKDLLPEGLDSVYRHFFDKGLSEITREGRMGWPTSEQIEKAEKAGYTQAIIIPGGISSLDILKTIYSTGPQRNPWRVHLLGAVPEGREMNFEAVEKLREIAGSTETEQKTRIIFVRQGDIMADSPEAGEILGRTKAETARAIKELEKIGVGPAREARLSEILIRLLCEYQAAFDRNDGDANKAWIALDESLYSEQIFPEELRSKEGESPRHTTQATAQFEFNIGGQVALIGLDTQSNDGITIITDNDVEKMAKAGIAHPLVLEVEVSETKK